MPAIPPGTYVAAGFSQEEAVQAVKTEVHEPVTKISSDSASSDLVPYTYYFRYIPYLFLGALCYTMGYILMAFKKGDIQKRMEASAISVRRQSLEGLLVNIIGAVGSWNLGDLQWLISLNASLVKVSWNLHNIFHITVKEIFLKYFRIIFHRNYIVNRVKIINKSLSQNALIFLYHSNINAGICIKAVFIFTDPEGKL